MRDQAPLRVDDIGAARSPTLICETTSQISLRLTSAMLTPASRRVPCDGERHIRLGFAAEVDRTVIDLVLHRLGELGSLEKSELLPTTSAASRDTRSRSLPVASTCDSSVMAGTWRNSRKASKRRCSIDPADHGGFVAELAL